MEDKSLNKRRRHKINFTPGENDFAGLDKWAHSLRLEDGRPLTTTERNEERVARNVGRPTKPQSAKAKRVMIRNVSEITSRLGHFLFERL
jgi:hypothetical protein